MKNKKLFSRLFLTFLFIFTIALIVGDAVKLTQVFHVQRQILKLNENIALTREIDRKVGNITTAYFKTYSRYNFLNKILPNNPGDADIAQELTTLADNGNISFVDLKQGKAIKIARRELGSVFAINFVVEFIGTYKDSVQFIRNLNKLVRLVTITGIQMESVKYMLPNIFTSVKLRVYYLK